MVLFFTENIIMIKQISPWIDHCELSELEQVIKSTFVTENNFTKEFESMLSNLTNSKHVIAMSNGTSALFCALKALNIGFKHYYETNNDTEVDNIKIDEVIVPNLTFVATSNAVILAGAKPVFCDIRTDNFCIDHTKIEKLINEKTKAIIPVHLYGQSADMDEILSIAQKYKLYLIEDAAQGIGVTYKGKHVGTFADAGCISFYGNKTITCGEGGALLTNNSQLAQSCYRLKNHGRDKRGTFIHETIGFNFSFTEMQAAIGISQLKKLPRIIERKKDINKRYQHLLQDIKEMQPIIIDDKCAPVYWFTSYICDYANELHEYLLENEIETRRFFYPLHLQPCYQYMKIHKDSFPISNLIYKKGISLPSSYLLKEEEIEIICNKIRKFFKI